MPWTVKDVDKHKKGLNPTQKKKWVSIANGVLRDCQAKGGKDCEGKAIRVANSKFSEEGGDLQTMEKIPKLALTFSNHEDGSVQLSREDGSEPRLHILGYSGGIIKGHWWWGDLAIDLEGMSFPEKKYPVLEEHQRDRKIAFAKKPIIRENKLMVEDGTFVDTEASKEFVKLSKQGFPYQASIHAHPTIVEKLEDGASAEVNGFKFKGPGTIWRKSVFREVSVCVFGWDKNTRSEALGDVEINYSQVVWDSTTAWEDSNSSDSLSVPATELTIYTGEEVKKTMTLKEMKEKDPEGYAALMAEATESAKAELQNQHEEEKNELSAQLSDVREELKGSNEKLKELEKKETIRAEKERQLSIERDCKDIWAEKLADSDLSENAKKKLPEYVDPQGFLTEDGTLDTEKFAAAVDAEIKYWVEEVGATVSVLGSGFSKKKADLDAQDIKSEEKEDDRWVGEMVELAGEERPEQTT